FLVPGIRGTVPEYIEDWSAWSASFGCYVIYITRFVSELDMPPGGAAPCRAAGSPDTFNRAGSVASPGFHQAFTAGFYNARVCSPGPSHGDTDGAAPACGCGRRAGELPDRVHVEPGNRRQAEPGVNRPP